MTIRNEATSGYAHVVDLDMMGPQIEALVAEVVSSALSAEILRQALSAGMNEIASVLRAVPIAEGRLLERGIGLVAKGNPDLVVLTDNLRLPVTKAASELVAMNDPSLVRSLSLDADNGGRKSYTPDLLILNRATKIAHLVDVKRSLGSYEVSRITELKQRMLAAALVVPDLLFKEHRRLHVEEVRVVILNAENQRTNIEGGVWPLNQLDHLLEMTGAGRLLECVREAFRVQVEANWAAALRGHRSGIADAPAAHGNGLLDHSTSASSVGVADAAPIRVPVSIGFARPPRIVGA